MNTLNMMAGLCVALIICLFACAQVEAGGDKSAKTTVITLAGGGEKHGGSNYIPIPVPVCSGRGGHHGGYMHHGGHHGGFGAQARMAWRR